MPAARWVVRGAYGVFYSHTAFKRSNPSSLLLVMVAALAAMGVDAPPDTAARHQQQGVEHHLRRALDAASREYARTLALDPARDPMPDELGVVQRFAPRLHTTPTEPFPLKDAAAVVHPAERLIAYHLFWDDDIDFPKDNDPCDHEVVWVQYSADWQTLERVWTYFHGRILVGGDAAMADARAHAMRPRVNVQWGKHGSMPVGWEQMSIIIEPGDGEHPDASTSQSMTLGQYNDDTFRRLSTAGRRLPGHPLGRRLGWAAPASTRQSSRSTSPAGSARCAFPARTGPPVARGRRG